MSVSEFGKWLGNQDATTIVIGVCVLLAIAVGIAIAVTKRPPAEKKDAPK